MTVGWHVQVSIKPHARPLCVVMVLDSRKKGAHALRLLDILPRLKAGDSLHSPDSKELPA